MNRTPIFTVAPVVSNLGCPPCRKGAGVAPRWWATALALLLILSLPGVGRTVPGQTDVSLFLHEGWNLITLPLIFAAADGGAGTVLTQAGLNENWLWSAGAWQPVAADEVMLTGKGVWVKSPSTKTITISGYQQTMIYAWSTGWNLTGVTGDADTTVQAAAGGAILMDNEEYSPSAKVISVWRWQNNAWAVNLPGEPDKGQQYASDNGLAFFTDLKHFEGFWAQVGPEGTAPALPPDHPEATTTTTAGSSTTTTTGGSTTTSLGTTTSTTAGSSTTTTTTLAVTTIPLTSGWNLVGTRVSIPKVAPTFASKEQFVSVWKWLGTGWSVFLAGEEPAGTYAKSKGFAVLDELSPGEGFWVNAAQDGALSLPGQAVSATELTLAEGWNLKTLPASQPLSALTLFTPPTPAQSVWAWQDNAWAVLLPGETEPGLYAQSKGFVPLITLKPDRGFWVNASSSASIPLPTPPPNLGSLVYTAATDLQSTTTYLHDGNPAVVSVADGAGYVWTLTIPYGALPWPEKVTLTPFASLDSQGSSTKVKSGVRLEPDGLQFVQPATLSVKPPTGTQATGLLFSANHDGSGVQFAPTEIGTASLSAQIEHFSAEAYDPDPSQEAIDSYTKKAEEEYAFEVNEAKAFLAKGAPPAPTPPAVCPYCQGTEANQGHGEYYEYQHAFFEPYQDITYVLLSAARSLELLGSQVDTTEGKALATQIAELALKSIIDEGKKYEEIQPPEQLTVVIPVALQAARQVQLLGGEGTVDVVAQWCKTIRDYYFDQFKTQHDYRAWPLLISLERNYELVGGAEDGFVNKALDAVTFEVKWENTFSYGPGQVTQKADLKGLGMKIEQGWWWDNITFDYTSGSMEEYPLILPLSTTTLLTMWNWDPCLTKTVDVVVWGGFGEAKEVYDGMPSGFKGFTAGGAGLEAYASQVVQGNPAGYMFTVPMNNKNATLGEQDFSGSGAGGNAQAQSHITIIHTPK